jgi:hypothetical protein
MAKYKAPKGKKSTAASDLRGALPCLVVVLAIFGLLMFLFYLVVKSSS